MPTLGTQACPIPSVWLTATADILGAQRWEAPLLIEKLEAQVDLLEAHGRLPDLFIGYLASAAQAAKLDDWLAENEKRFGRIWVDPISGDNGRAYVPAELVTVWRRLVARGDVLLPNSTEISLLAEAEGLNREAWLDRYKGSAQVIETSARSASDNPGICIHEPKESRFIEVVWEPGRYRGTGDLFAAFLIASVGAGWAWDAAVKRAAEQVRKAIRNTRESGSESLILP